MNKTLNLHDTVQRWCSGRQLKQDVSRVAAVLLLFWAGQCLATTYYVDSSIPDVNVASGTPDFTTYNPVTFDPTTGTANGYNSLADLAATVLVEGDAVYFRRGQTWHGKLSFSNSVTFGAFGTGSLPKIVGSGSDYAGYANSASNFTVQDIEFANASFTAVYVYNSYAVANNNTFRRCKFTITGSVPYGSGKYCLLINPNILPMNGYVVDSNEMSGGDSGIVLATWGGSPSLSDFTISNNFIHDIVGSGIKIHADFQHASPTSSPYGIDINGNTISRTGYQAIWIMGGLRNIDGHPSYVRNNLATEIGGMGNSNINAFQLNWLRGTIIERNTVANVYTSAPDGNGIFPDIAWQSQLHRSSDIIVRYNTVSGCRASVGRTAGICAGSTSNSLFYGNISYNNEIGMEFVTMHATGNVFYNNVFDGNSYGVMIPQSMYGLGYAPTSIWRNNIFANNSVSGIYYALGNTPPTESNNLFFNNGAADIWGATTISPDPGPQPLDSSDNCSDPLFVDRSGADYHLQANSAAINAGLNSVWAGTASVSDFAGTPITDSSGAIVAPGGGVDIGAHEFTIKGDLDSSGDVSIADAMSAMQISLGILEPTADDLKRGDVAPIVNGKPQPDGNIDIGDVVLIMERVVGLKTW